VIRTLPQAEWSGLDPADESELPNLDSEPNIGGIYIRLLVKNPGWILRKPKETLGDLLEAALQALQKDAVIIPSIIIIFITLFCYFIIIQLFSFKILNSLIIDYLI